MICNSFGFWFQSKEARSMELLFLIARSNQFRSESIISGPIFKDSKKTDSKFSINSISAQNTSTHCS
jgi:hypothetical protein